MFSENAKKNNTDEQIGFSRAGIRGLIAAIENLSGNLLSGIVALFQNPPESGVEDKAPSSAWAYDHDADPNAHHPQIHATEHVTDGGDVIPDAVSRGDAGLMTGLDKLKLTNQVYIPDASEADQGVINGTKWTIKYLIDTVIGATKEATIKLAHTGSGDKTTYQLSTSETIPSNITLEIENGAILSIDNEVILTINSPFSAGLYQVFSGDGSVSFGVKAVEKVWVDWWKENTIPGTTDMSTAVLKATDSVENIGCDIYFKPTTYILNDVYIEGNETDGLNPGEGGPSFIGFGDNSGWSLLNTYGGTILKAKEGADYIIKLGSSTQYLSRVSFKNIAFDGNDNAADGIWSDGAVFTHLENVVFSKCKGAFIPQRADRLTMTKCAFYSNTYGIYYDADVHGTTHAASGISFIDCHHRSNDYNMYLDADRTDFQFVLRGGYWTSAVYADFYITGGVKQLVLDGVNLENPSDKPNEAGGGHKVAQFQIGQVTGGTHEGIDYISIENCMIQDNNATVGYRPILMTVVDSTDTSKPSLRVLRISNNVFRNCASTPLIAKASAPTTEISLVSEIAIALWKDNDAPGITPPVASNIWTESALASSRGLGQKVIYKAQIKETPIIMPLLARTASFTARLSEVGGVYTNEGASGTVIFTLPAVVEGYSWYFVNMEAGKVIRLDPQDDEGFVDGSGLGKYKDISSTVGHGALVVGVSTTKAKAWQAIPLNGATLTNE